MKADKPKGNKKTTSKTTAKATKQVAKKELEATITEKFMEVVSSFGHDAGKFGKEIKKATKQLAKKLADKFHSAREAANKSQPKKKANVKAIKKSVSLPKLVSSKAVTKAEKVVARVTQTKAEVKPKRAYNRRVVVPVEEKTSALPPKKQVPAVKKSANKATKSAAVSRAPKVKANTVEQKAPAVRVEEKNGKEQDIDNSTVI